MQLQDSVRKIKGIGEKAEQCLSKLGIASVAELLEHYPRTYDEFKPIQPIAEIREGELVAVEGSLTARPQIKRKGKLSLININLRDASGQVLVTWFNMPFLSKQLRMGTRYILRGKVSRKNGRLVMDQPAILTKEEFYSQLGKLKPIYPLTAGLTNNALIKAVSNALKETEGILDYMPSQIKKRQGLMDYKKALKTIHFPGNKMEAREARRRLAFDELFLYSLALAYLKKTGKNKSQFHMEYKADLDHFIQGLPYQLTDCQIRTWKEISQDMCSGYCMNRLVQGDVGSGKTIIAILALYLTVLNGGQACMMAPTEVLANQHYKGLCQMMEPLGIRVCLFSGSQRAKEKRQVKEELADGRGQILVGTHAVIQGDVVFQNLGLVVTDEQHRFGVRQRETLFEKGREPHVLAMSATPIPRTLALILYGDMDLSVMDQPPANRLPIKNALVNTDYRPNAYRFMQEQIQEGRQVYVICPMVEESQESDLENVMIYTESLREVFPPHVKIQELHGKMKAQEKDQIMESFGRGEIHILVSTTVIEVGIDVPNATVILIENAERFGLAQLHQLRGRVGRGKHQSYCIIMTGHDSKESRERLEILAKSNDGFYIAREDLKLRGQGDLFGLRQSGDQLFALADIFEDADLLKEATQEAGLLTEEEIQLFYKKNTRLKRRIEDYLGQVTL